jgi:hypothetical protein
MSLDELVKLMPPPANPIETAPRDIRLMTKAGRQLGLPNEWKQFGITYGSGVFLGKQATVLYVHNLFASSFLRETDAALDRLRDSKSLGGDEGVPYAIFPEENGLLPLGHDNQGTHLWWRTAGDPNSWPIVVQWFLGPKYFRELKMPLTELLVGLVRGEIHLPPFPHPWLRDEVVFVPKNETFW